MSALTDERQVPLDTLPIRLAIARIAAGHHNAASAALACGVSGQTWRNWERGVHVEAVLRPSMLRYIATQLGVGEAWLRNGGPLGTTTHPTSPSSPATPPYRAKVLTLSDRQRMMPGQVAA